MWFKSYEHFHLLLTDGQTNSHSDYSPAPKRRAIVVQTDYTLVEDACTSWHVHYLIAEWVVRVTQASRTSPHTLVG